MTASKQDQTNLNHSHFPFVRLYFFKEQKKKIVLVVEGEQTSFFPVVMSSVLSYRDVNLDATGSQKRQNLPTLYLIML